MPRPGNLALALCALVLAGAVRAEDERGGSAPADLVPSDTAPFDVVPFDVAPIDVVPFDAAGPDTDLTDAGLPDLAAPDSALPDLAVMGTIPLYWGEAGGLEQLLAGESQAHWARAQIERDYRLAPLDYLSAEALAGYERLLMAQPRALSPEENVALDGWVRAGGRLLLLADPMMTGQSRFGIGDRRRPQHVALLSPILAHWGLRLTFDENQSPGLVTREIAGRPVPLNMHGRVEVERGPASCAFGGEAVLARCRLGRGTVAILADAAVLDLAGPWPGAGAALAMLLETAFAGNGEIAGNRLSAPVPSSQDLGIPRFLPGMEFHQRIIGAED